MNQDEIDYLNKYDSSKYQTPITTVDIAIVTLHEQQLKVMLAKRDKHPFKDAWALPGGFVDVKQDQTLEDTAHRKLFEKTGVKTPYLEQIYTVGNNSRDPRSWSITVVYMALVSADLLNLHAQNASEQIQWFGIDELTQTDELAFDHLDIIKACKDRLRSKVEYTSLPVHLLAESFTLTELQQAFEIILGTALEKKSFRRRILDAGILEETGEMKTGNNRPAKLYRYNGNKNNHFFNRNIEGAR